MPVQQPREEQGNKSAFVYRAVNQRAGKNAVVQGTVLQQAAQTKEQGLVSSKGRARRSVLCGSSAHVCGRDGRAAIGVVREVCCCTTSIDAVSALRVLRFVVAPACPRLYPPPSKDQAQENSVWTSMLP
jgi:hypothetical protein